MSGWTSRWRRLGRQLAANPIGVLGAVTILVVAVVAVVAGALAPFDPTAQIARPLQSPGGQYLLGTDEFGRDVLSRLMFGARISLYVGFVSVAIGLSVGGAVGVIAGYYGGKVDALLMRVVESLFAFPSLLLAIAIAGILGASLTHAMLAIGIVFVPTFARLARGSVLSVVGLDYVGAARTLGAGDWPIIRRHVLPNVLAPLIVQTTLALSGAILTEASLSFLGLGTQPPDPSWGTMLGAGRRYMETAPWVAVFPGLAISLTVLGFNLLGDGLRDYLDPRLRGA
jgi:peptide/nickel transport system permease protein